MVLAESRPWVQGWIGGALNAIGILVLIGVLAAGFVAPIWAVAGYLAFVLVGGLGEGTYRVWDRTERQLTVESRLVERLSDLYRDGEELLAEIRAQRLPPKDPKMTALKNRMLDWGYYARDLLHDEVLEWSSKFQRTPPRLEPRTTAEEFHHNQAIQYLDSHLPVLAEAIDSLKGRGRATS
jgi:hypothetical protein